MNSSNFHVEGIPEGEQMVRDHFKEVMTDYGLEWQEYMNPKIQESQ